MCWDENFSRDREGFTRVSGFPNVPGFVLLGMTDVCTSGSQKCVCTFSYDALNVWCRIR